MYNFQVEDYHTYYVGELAVWVHNADKKYGNGYYENNPSDNPKVLADAQEDPNAVYGYRPRSDGSLKKLVDTEGIPSDNPNYINWSDPKFVENARNTRLKYISEENQIRSVVDDLRNKGYSDYDIAHEAYNKRNEIRLKSYLDSEGNIINQNGYNAAIERMNGPDSFESLIKRKTPEEIIKSATKTNPGMDACVGLYDYNFDTYGR